MDTGRRNRIAELGELQLATLDALKSIDEGTIYDVLECFPQAQRPRYTTVLTVLRGLEEKGLATHRTEGRTYIFRPTEQAMHVRGRLLSDVVERVFGGSPTDLVAALLATDAVTPEVLAELRALLNEEGDENHAEQ